MNTKITFCAGADWSGRFRFDKFEGEVADCPWLRIAIGSLRSRPECNTLQCVQFVRGRKVVTIDQARYKVGKDNYEYHLTLWKDWKRQILHSVDEAMEIIMKLYEPTKKKSDTLREVA